MDNKIVVVEEFCIIEIWEKWKRRWHKCNTFGCKKRYMGCQLPFDSDECAFIVIRACLSYIGKEMYIQ